VALSDTVTVPGQARLVLVGGSFGSGSQVVIDGDVGTTGEAFSSIAAIGTSNAGAVQYNGLSNTITTISDLSIRGQDGANLLLGKSAADLVISGNSISIDLTNVPNSGTGLPTYFWKDSRDLSFLADRSPVPNVSTQAFTNLPGSSNIVLVGDNDLDRRLAASPGTTLIDASQSIAHIGTGATTVSYDWIFLGGPTTPTTSGEDTPTLSFRATQGGVYTFELVVTVRDASGQPVVSANTDAFGRQRVIVTIEVIEAPPVASAGPDRVVVGLTTPMDGSGCFDPNGGGIAFNWSGVTTNGQTLPVSAFSPSPFVRSPTFQPGAPGTFTVTVTVYKTSTNQSAADSAQITLSDPSNQVPTADAGLDQVSRVNVLVTLDGSQSRDPEGASLFYRWTIVSAASATVLSDPSGPNPTFTPQVPGAYTFELVVDDGVTAGAPDRVTVRRPSRRRDRARRRSRPPAWPPSPTGRRGARSATRRRRRSSGAP
jgi:hypothetical protein